MIKDKLENAKTYYGISENLKKGFEWLKSQDLKNINEGKYLISGEDIYANVQEYETKSDSKYEAHRKYADIQYIVKGRELVGVCDINDCKSITPYDSDSDVEFLECGCEENWQKLNEGEFLVLFPHDAHKPCINPSETKTSVKKIVVKVSDF